MLVASLFLTLAWADATGLGGSLPAWWLLPIAILLAVGGIDELVIASTSADKGFVEVNQDGGMFVDHMLRRKGINVAPTI